jgi:hypothetical protein
MNDQRHEDKEILRNVDSSVLTSAERDLHYFEKMEDGQARIYRYFTPREGRSDFPAGYEVAWEFEAADLKNASDRVNEWFHIKAGEFLADADGNAFRYDVDTFACREKAMMPPPAVGPQHSGRSGIARDDRPYVPQDHQQGPEIRHGPEI